MQFKRNIMLIHLLIIYIDSWLNSKKRNDDDPFCIKIKYFYENNIFGKIIIQYLKYFTEKKTAFELL